MSKALAFAATGTGASGIAVGGYLLTTKGKGTGEATKEEVQAVQELSFKNLDEFKTNPSKVGCVKDYFGEVKSSESVQAIAAQKPDGNSFFKSDSDKSTTQKGCLLVEYKKENYSEDKWKGAIFWLWTFSTDSEGFISFNMAETVDGGKLKFTGIFYLASKKSDGENNWEISHKAEAASADQIESKDLDKYFPKATTELVGANKSYWGLLATDKEADLQKVCPTTNNACKNPKDPASTIVTQEFSWTKNDANNSKTLKDWTDKLDWWNQLYSSTKTHWDLTAKIANFKGEWKSKTAQTNL